MSTRGINIKCAFATLGTHGRIISHGIGHRRNAHIVIGQQENGGRSKMTLHMELIAEFLDELWIMPFLSQQVFSRTGMTFLLVHRDDGIEKDGEIGTMGEIGMGRDSRSKMSASRRTHDSDIIGIDMPYISTIAHHLHGSHSIADGKLAVTMWQTILQHKAGYSLLIEILCPVGAFMLHSHNPVGSTRADYHGTTGGLLSRRKETTEGGLAILAHRHYKRTARRLSPDHYRT